MLEKALPAGTLAVTFNNVSLPELSCTPLQTAGIQGEFSARHQTHV